MTKEGWRLPRVLRTLAMTKSGALRGIPAEGVAEDKARWRVVARHDDVAEARGRLPPTNNLFFRPPFCILPPAPEKVVLKDRYPRRRGGLFFTPKEEMCGKRKKTPKTATACRSFDPVLLKLLKKRNILWPKSP